MRASFLRGAAAGALVAAACSPAVSLAADSFVAPATVIAQSDGSFTYTWKFYKGPGAATLAGSGWTGVENVPGGLAGDCFCFSHCVRAEGDSLTFTVSGQLQIPSLEGVVRNWISFCDAPGAESITRVLPYSTTGVGDSGAGSLSLWNGPNPFSTGTIFHYVLPEAGHVALRIHDLSGRVIATLWEGAQPAGRHSFAWNARAGGAPPGILFARLSHRGRVESRTIVRLR